LGTRDLKKNKHKKEQNSHANHKNYTLPIQPGNVPMFPFNMAPVPENPTMH